MAKRFLLVGVENPEVKQFRRLNPNVNVVTMGDRSYNHNLYQFFNGRTNSENLWQHKLGKFNMIYVDNFTVSNVNSRTNLYMLYFQEIFRDYLKDGGVLFLSRPRYIAKYENGRYYALALPKNVSKGGCSNVVGVVPPVCNELYYNSTGRGGQRFYPTRDIHNRLMK